MLLPDNAIELIKMQRSNYGKKNIIKKYNKDMENEFNQLLQFLPENCNSIIDIGCGLAGVSILLSNYYNYPELYLIDKNEISEKVKYGYSDNPTFYNSFEILKKILDMNMIENYYFIDPENDFSDFKNIDIVISLLACGFHFPINIYFNRIFYCLSANGIFVCDIRKTENHQIEIIKHYFKEIFEIKTDNPKTIRIFARGPMCRE